MILEIEKVNIAINMKNVTSVELHRHPDEQDANIYINMLDGKTFKSDVRQYEELKPIYDSLVTAWETNLANVYKI